MKNIREERQVVTPFIVSADRTVIYKENIFEKFEICEDKCTDNFLIYGIKKNNEKVLLTYESNRQDAETALGQLMECISKLENYYFPRTKDEKILLKDENIIGVVQKGEQLYAITEEGTYIECDDYSMISNFIDDLLLKEYKKVMYKQERYEFLIKREK